LSAMTGVGRKGEGGQEGGQDRDASSLVSTRAACHTSSVRVCSLVDSCQSCISVSLTQGRQSIVARVHTRYKVELQKTQDRRRLL
jgi:hypothetical protein